MTWRDERMLACICIYIMLALTAFTVGLAAGLVLGVML